MFIFGKSVQWKQRSVSIIAYVSSFQDQPQPPGAVAAGAGHVPGYRGGAGLDLRHPQQEDGPLSGEHRDGLRRHPEAARWDKLKKNCTQI